MSLTLERSDEAVLDQLGDRLARQRLNRDWSQAELAAAADVRPFIAADVNSRRLRTLIDSPAFAAFGLHAVVMDARAPSFARAATVLLDAPCTGTGTLRRRPDARWRLTQRRLMSLVELQRELLDACAGLIGSNGAVNLGRTTTLAAYTDGTEHYVTSFEFQGGGGEFGTLIPLPDVPTTARNRFLRSSCNKAAVWSSRPKNK